MKTIIEELTRPELEEKLSDALDEIADLEKQLEDAEAELKKYESGKPQTINTALGTITVFNESGNLQLRYEIQDFIEALKQKFL